MGRRLDPFDYCPCCGARLKGHPKSCNPKRLAKQTHASELRDKQAEHARYYGERLQDGFAALQGIDIIDLREAEKHGLDPEVY